MPCYGQTLTHCICLQATAEAVRQQLRRVEREAAAAQREIDNGKPASLSQVGARAAATATAAMCAALRDSNEATGFMGPRSGSNENRPPETLEWPERVAVSMWDRP